MVETISSAARYSAGCGTSGIRLTLNQSSAFRVSLATLDMSMFFSRYLNNHSGS